MLSDFAISQGVSPLASFFIDRRLLTRRLEFVVVVSHVKPKMLGTIKLSKVWWLSIFLLQVVLRQGATRGQGWPIFLPSTFRYAGVALSHSDISGLTPRQSELYKSLLAWAINTGIWTSIAHIFFQGKLQPISKHVHWRIEKKDGQFSDCA